ncbi:MAG TPA: hypothetical protein VMG41_07395 [Gemmatimonadales bacterium]|nr:hypothetical protein [Gemmatimonadales bacterium]
MRKALLVLVAALGQIVTTAGTAVAEAPGHGLVDSRHAIVITAWLVWAVLFLATVLGLFSRIKHADSALPGEEIEEEEEELQRAA